MSYTNTSTKWSSTLFAVVCLFLAVVAPCLSQADDPKKGVGLVARELGLPNLDDPYAVLGVPSNANDDTIKMAYRKLVRKFHPDLAPGDPDAAEKYRAVLDAVHRIENLRLTSFAFFNDKRALQVVQAYENGSKWVRIFWRDNTWDEGMIDSEGIPYGFWSRKTNLKLETRQAIGLAASRYADAPYDELKPNVLVLLEWIDKNGDQALKNHIRKIDRNAWSAKTAVNTIFERFDHVSRPEFERSQRMLLSMLWKTQYDRQGVTGLLLEGETYRTGELSSGTDIATRKLDQLSTTIKESGSDLFLESPYKRKVVEFTLNALAMDPEALALVTGNREEFLEILGQIRNAVPRIRASATTVAIFEDIFLSALDSPNPHHREIAKYYVLKDGGGRLDWIYSAHMLEKIIEKSVNDPSLLDTVKSEFSEIGYGPRLNLFEAYGNMLFANLRKYKDDPKMLPILENCIKYLFGAPLWNAKGITPLIATWIDQLWLGQLSTELQQRIRDMVPKSFREPEPPKPKSILKRVINLCNKALGSGK